MWFYLKSFIDFSLIIFSCYDRTCSDSSHSHIWIIPSEDAQRVIINMQILFNFNKKNKHGFTSLTQNWNTGNDTFWWYVCALASFPAHSQDQNRSDERWTVKMSTWSRKILQGFAACRPEKEQSAIVHLKWIFSADATQAFENRNPLRCLKQFTGKSPNYLLEWTSSWLQIVLNLVFP